MDERKILEEIRKSAENIDAPESLRPEQIEEAVRGKAQRNKRLPVYRVAATAAVLLLVLAVWQEGGALTPKTTGTSREIAEALTETTVSDCMESEEVSADSEIESGTSELTLEEAIPSASSEEELYLVLAEMDRDKEYDMGAELSGSTAEASADVAEEAVAEDAESGGSSGDYSETNLQESGVDEGDIVKTDGEYIYTLAGSKLYIVKADGGELAQMSEIELPDLSESVEEFYLDGDVLVFIATGSSASLDETSDDVYYVTGDSYTKAYTYDISDRSAPKLSGSVTQEGYYMTSRKNGDMLYLFTEYTPVIGETKETSDILPEAGGESLAVEDVYLPEYVGSMDYLVISSVDVNNPDEVISHKAIVSAAELFYVSTENIYICGSRYENSAEYTRILKFGYSDGEIQPVAAGEISGYLNDSFSMNEYEGYLRVVTTDWGSDEEVTHLYVLDEDLSVCGRIENLAPGESVRSARFMGDTGYFVTFRETDPLFSADLSNPSDPQILGELKVTGFSSYLHFYGEDMLLGIGNEVDEDTEEYLGIKVSMFDISDPADVQEADRYVIEDAYDCPGLYNYKAIMINPAKNIFGFLCEYSYYVFSYDEDEGFVKQFQYESESYSDDVRGLYIGETLYISDGNVLAAFDMADGFEKTGELILGQK